MNVELEDGTVVTDVPEGTTKSQLMSRVNKMRQPAQEPSLMRRATDYLGKAAESLTPYHTGQDMTKAKSIGEGFETGLGDTIMQAGQLMENVPGVSAAREGVGKVLGVKPNSMREIVKQREEEYQAERAKAGRSGIDVARIAGNIANPINIAAGVAGGVPATLGQAIKTGAQVGAVTGGLQPYTGEGNLAVETGKQALEGGAAGAVTGGAIYGGAKVGNAIGEGVSDLSDYFTKEGYKNLARKHLVKNIGEAQVPEVRAALNAAAPTLPARAPVQGAQGPTLPASPMTAAEAVKDLSAGSPVQAMQKITYETPGGPSKMGGDIQREALAAQVAARANANAVTKPMREEALKAANQAGGVKVNSIIKDIGKMETDPNWRASDVVGKTLGNIREKIAELKDPAWRMDARDLYTIRKEIGNMIEKNAKDSSSWDKRLAAKLQNEIQDSIDTAIERAGGTGWRDYLSTYSKMLGKIESDVAAKESLYKPLQKSIIQRGTNVSEGTLPGGGGPPLLKVGYTVPKWLVRVKAESLEPKVDAYMAELFRHAPNLGKALADQPAAKRNAIVQALMQQAPGVAGQFAGRP